MEKLPNKLTRELLWHLENSSVLAEEDLYVPSTSLFERLLEDAEAHHTAQLPEGLQPEFTKAIIIRSNNSPFSALLQNRDIHSDSFGLYSTAISTDRVRNAGTIRIDAGNGFLLRKNTTSDEALKDRKRVGPHAKQTPRYKYRKLTATQAPHRGTQHIPPYVDHCAPNLADGCMRLFIRSIYYPEDERASL